MNWNIVRAIIMYLLIRIIIDLLFPKQDTLTFFLGLPFSFIAVNYILKELNVDL